MIASAGETPSYAMYCSSLNGLDSDRMKQFREIYLRSAPSSSSPTDKDASVLF